MHLKSMVAAAMALVTGLSGANAAEEDARAAKVMWTAWLCSTYAELSGDVEEQRRLFTLGYSSGQRFVAAAAAGTITAEEANSIVPMAVGFLMAGPSEEFILGRVFESAANQGYDDVVKHDANGTYLELKDWVNDDDLKASIATNKYMQGNCELLR